MANQTAGKIAENPGFRRLLSEGLAQLGYPRDDFKEQQLLRYLDMLVRWNKAYNLTAITDPAIMIYRHILDSLAIAKYLQGKSFIDIGSGAGLPGIPLAIWLADRSFVLLDSNGKKTRFLVQVKLELELPNIKVIHSRAENYQTDACFDGVLTRAFASLADMVEMGVSLLARDGVFYAMKGKVSEQELSAIPKTYTLRATRVLDIPGGAEQRHLVELTR